MKKKMIITNVMAPLFLGAGIYYLFFPKTVFVGMIDNLLGVSCHVPIGISNIFISMMRFYALDFIWAYALMSLIVCLFGYDSRIITAVIIFVIVMELLQLLPSFRGTFDVRDIVVEIIACILVILLFRRRLINEKD